MNILTFIDAHPVVFTCCFIAAVIAGASTYSEYLERRYGGDDPA